MDLTAGEMEGSRAGGEGRGSGWARPGSRQRLIVTVLMSHAEVWIPKAGRYKEGFEQGVVCSEAGSRKITLRAGGRCWSL